jgi:hypothetical protein
LHFGPQSGDRIADSEAELIDALWHEARIVKPPAKDWWGSYFDFAIWIALRLIRGIVEKFAVRPLVR